MVVLDGRLPMGEILLRFAEELAQRSTCKRLQVGAVVTDGDHLQVLGIGYNGTARGLPNTCDSDVPGQCGCLHAELNALLKAPGIVIKHLFVSDAPCAMCAKAAVNANVMAVYYRRVYRSNAGLLVLDAAGVFVQRLANDGDVHAGPHG
jgi:dCMP deaminase